METVVTTSELAKLLVEARDRGVIEGDFRNRIKSALTDIGFSFPEHNRSIADSDHWICVQLHQAVLNRRIDPARHSAIDHALAAVSATRGDHE